MTGQHSENETSPKANKKKRLKRIISLVILMVIVFFFARFISGNWQKFSEIQVQSPEQVVLIVLFFITNLLLQGALNTIILRALNIDMGVVESAAITAISRFGNYFLPMKGGLATKAVYLKKRYDCNYSDFLAQSAAGYFVSFLVAGLLGLGALILIHEANTVHELLFLFFGAVSFGTLVIFIWNPVIPDLKIPLASKFLRILHGWNMTRGKHKIQFQLVALNMLFIFIRGWSIYFQFTFFGFEVDYIAALFLAVLNPFQTLVSITPSGLGIREVIMVFSATLIGISVEVSTAVALLGRLIRFLTVALLSPMASWYLYKYKGFTAKD